MEFLKFMCMFVMPSLLYKQHMIYYILHTPIGHQAAANLWRPHWVFKSRDVQK